MILLWCDAWSRGRGEDETYVDAPEFFHAVECDDFFEEIIPVVALVASGSADVVFFLVCHGR